MNGFVRTGDVFGKYEIIERVHDLSSEINLVISWL